MTRATKTPDDENDLPVEALLRAAGRRTAPEARGREAAKESVRAAWQASVAATADERPTRYFALAAAALVVLGIATGLFFWNAASRPSAPAGLSLASIEAISGDVFLDGEAIDRSESAAGDEKRIDAGALLETRSGGRIALRLQTGHSVRLDTDTRVRWLSATSLGLERGAVYAASGNTEGTSIEVVTPYGSARDIGTQFLAQVKSNELEILVREGSVELATPRETRTATAGESLSAAKDGRVEISATPGYGANWQWALEVAPPFELEGKTVGEFLDWVARETGWTILFEDPEIAPSARENVIHGAIKDLRPDLAAEIVLPTAGLVAERDGSRLIVRSATP